MNSKFYVLVGSRSKLSVPFFLCAFCFVLGSVIGTVIALTVPYSGDLLSFFLQLDSVGLQTPGALSITFMVFLFPLLALFLAMSALGFLMIPLLSGLRGFLLSFAVAVYVRALGEAAILPVFAIFAITALMTLPCFFLIASRSCLVSFSMCRTFVGTGKPVSLMSLISPKNEVLVLMGLLTAAAFFEAYLKLPLLRLLLKN